VSSECVRFVFGSQPEYASALLILQSQMDGFKPKDAAEAEAEADLGPGEGVGFMAEAGGKLAGWAADTMALQGAERWRAVLWAPADVARRLTVPSMAVEAEGWDRWWAVTAAPCAPLFLLFTARDLVPMDLEVLPHGMGRCASNATPARRDCKGCTSMNPSTRRLAASARFADRRVRGRAARGRHVPLWALVAAQGCVLGAALHSTTATVHIPATGPLHWLMCAVAFVTSIAWISLCANELLGCLSALGLIMGISPTILGVTVRAQTAAQPHTFSL